jgi:hypothetical protein
MRRSALWICPILRQQDGEAMRRLSLRPWQHDRRSNATAAATRPNRLADFGIHAEARARVGAP